MYKMIIEPLQPKEGHDNSIVFEEDSVFESLKHIKQTGLMVNGKIITETRLVSVEKTAKIITFQLLNATGLLVAHAYLKRVE